MKVLLVLGLAIAAMAFPTPNEAHEKSPDKFTVKMNVANPDGEIEMEVDRSWSPNGADRFYNLVKNGFYDKNRFFRYVQNFVVQFGINGDPEVQANWRGSEANIQDDPVKQSNERGMVSFASAGPNTRTTQVFINLKENENLDDMGFSPFAKVTKGMELVDQLFKDYGEKPNQGSIQSQGNMYLEREFPKLSYIASAKVS